MFNVLMKDKRRSHTGVDPGFREGGGGLKIIFTMGEGMEGHATPIRGQVRFVTFPFICM